MTTFHFNLKTLDEKPISKLVCIPALKVKIYQELSLKRDLVFWFNYQDVPSGRELTNPAIRMYLRELEEVSPNKFLVKDFGGREFNLELLYVE